MAEPPPCSGPGGSDLSKLRAVIREAMSFGRQHDHFGANIDSAVEIDDVLIDQSDAAARYATADGRGLIGAVNAIDRVAKIYCASAERIAETAGHEARQVRLPDHHLGRRSPIRPF